MVGIMAPTARERVASLINSVIFASDIPSKLDNLHQLKQDLSQVVDSVLLSEFLSSLLKLLSDRTSPVRKCVTEIIGEIGLKHLEFLPEIVPSLLIVVNDDTPAVARQAITSGTNIFGCTLEKIAIQGLHTSELDASFESAWAWMLKLKEKIYSIAFQAGSDGRRLLALKFIAAIILIYTPDPSGSAEPPPHLVGDGKEVGFNISWLRRGHPILKVGDLSIEASQSLGLLLDQLRLPNVKSLSNSMVVVLINCLSAIATKRPSFYGRILPVLLSLDPSNLVIKGLHAYGVQHALKNAFLSCLKCTHPSAVPWRDRLVGALREMKSGELAEQVLEGVFNINGNIKEEKGDSVVKEEQLVQVQDTMHNKVGRKRSSDQELVERSEDDDTPGKRARSIHTSSEGMGNKSDADRTALEVKTDSPAQAIKSEEDVLGPVQQLVAVFGDLIAQGDKAAASLEILISSISADLLAEVVIASLRNLPSTRPMGEADGELLGDMASRESRIFTDTPFRELSTFLTNAFTPRISQQMSSAVDVHPPASDDLESPHAEESSTTDVARNGACATSSELSEIVHSDLPCTLTAVRSSEVAQGFSSAAVSELQDMGTVDAVIPGLDNAPGDGLPDTVTSSSLVSTDQDDASQDQATSGKISKPESVPSMSAEKSEELSPKTVAMDLNTGTISTATSLGQVQQFVLPKISAPVIALSDEEKDKLQKFLFVRILEAYKQAAVAGGTQLRFSLLAYLGVEFPLDLDPWELLQTHILSDYINHEGHELTLRVLYRLYGEAEEERDFFSSSTATSVYETFLLKVAETLRDSFPASDKSLSRLLGEVPYLPKSVLKLLECLCCPESGDKDEKEVHSGDRVTQGLSAVWSLILLRPSLRNVLLRIALQSAVHHLEEVRMKAIRLVANKLYPLPSIALQIEEYANERLLSVVDRHIQDTADAEKSTQLQKNPEVLASTDQATADILSKETSAHATESSTAESISTTSISEAQRCMSLYFALCTKKHALLQQIFIFYKSSPESVKQAVHRHMPILIRTMGASPALLEIISDPPDGSENLLMQVLHTLTDGIVPSTELIFTIKKLYESKMKDVEILLPILSFLPKEEVLRVFPCVVNLPQDKFHAALARLLQGSTSSGSTLSPSEVLIAIHGIDPDKDGIPLKKVTEACNACFEQNQIFTQQVIAKVLNQLVEQIPLPLLFMRTVLQAIGAFPALVDFIMDILSRLVSKQIWKYPKLWVGFLKCAQLTQPHSFNVLLQLPPTQLESALNKIPALKAPLSAHANQSNLKSTLPRSLLVVLGIAFDSQAASQSQSAQPEVADASSSDKDAVTEKSKESSGGN